MKKKSSGKNRDTKSLIRSLFETCSQYKKHRDANEDNVLVWGECILKSIAIIKAMGKTGDKKAIPALSRMLSKTHLASIRAAAAQALQNINNSAAIPPLLKTVKKDTIASVLIPAIQTLCTLQTKRAVKPLLTIINNKKLVPEIKNCAAAALAELGNEKTILHLEKVMKENSLINKELFGDAIRKIRSRSKLYPQGK